MVCQDFLKLAVRYVDKNNEITFDCGRCDMDRRRKERQTLNSEVMLSCEHFGLLHGRAKNISDSGVYIEIGRAVVGHDTNVDVSFVTAQGAANVIHTVSAKVERIDPR